MAVVALSGLLVTGAVDAIRSGTAPLGTVALLTGLGSGFTYGLYTLFSKAATERYADPIAPVFWMFAFATLGMTVLQPPFEAMARPHGEWPALIGLGIVPTLVPYALYVTALRHLRASTAAMLASIEPAVAALLAALLLGERMQTLQFAGMVLVVCAAILLAREASGGAAEVG